MATSILPDVTNVNRVGVRAISKARETSIVNASIVRLHDSSYMFAWLSIVGLHVVCAVFLTQLARVYAFLAHPYMDYWTQVISPKHQGYYRQVGWGFGAIAALHYWQLLSILWTSLRARELALPDGSFSVMQLFEKVRGPQSSRLMTSHLKTLALPSRMALRAWRALFSRRGVFGVESDFFVLVFTAREVVEIVSQTFQARRSSESLSRPWLNNLLVMLVVVNCWSTPVLQRLLYHHQSLERVVCLLFDVVLNIGSSVLIPLAVFLPYYRAFLPEYWTFPLELLYDTRSFTSLMMENELLFSLASADIVSRMVPHVGIYSSLVSAATLVRRRGSRRKSRAVSALTHCNSTLGIRGRHTTKTTDCDTMHAGELSMPTTQQDTVGAVAVSSPNQRLIARASRSKTSIVHGVFFLWGLVVLILHVRVMVRLRENVVGCQQVMGSWFTTSYACSVYTYNCARHGTQSPDDTSWPQLDEATLLYLTIADCSALKVPHAIQSYPNLIGMQLYNTTLVEWTKENAVSATKHSKMAVFLISKTNMTGIPDGLLEPLPDTLVDIEIAHTNLTSLPPDLSTKWHAMATFYLEHSQLTTFPEALRTLSVDDLSLYGNRITRVPELADIHHSYFSFVLSANPLTELPETLGDNTEFLYFSAERTLLTRLPAWTRTSIAEALYLYGTPYCASQQQDEDPHSDDLLKCNINERDKLAGGKMPVEILDVLASQHQ